LLLYTHKTTTCTHLLSELNDKWQLVLSDELGDGSSLIGAIKVVAALVKLNSKTTSITSTDAES
jgi:hypothetical protein